MNQIVKIPNSVLTTPARPVTVFGKEITNLINRMKATLAATVNPKGVGLAATQIGESWRVFLTRPREKDQIRVFINPEILSQSDPVNTPDKPNGKLEGCLSIPEIWGHVKRSPSVTLRYQDETGAVHEEEFSGFIATIVQHETDHLNGILFTQRVLEQEGKFYKSARDPDGKEVMDEISI